MIIIALLQWQASTTNTHTHTYIHLACTTVQLLACISFSTHGQHISSNCFQLYLVLSFSVTFPLSNFAACCTSHWTGLVAQDYLNVILACNFCRFMYSGDCSELTIDLNNYQYTINAAISSAFICLRYDRFCTEILTRNTQLQNATAAFCNSQDIV
jgi:hypothetical protein